MLMNVKQSLLFFFLVALVSPSYALSLGEIHVASALNQPLLAEIPIDDTELASLLDVRVEMASDEVHAQLGIEKVAVLNKVRFKVVRKPQGQFVIRLTTQAVIREPVLEFVLEVGNRSGNLRRSYAIHLDPPHY